MIKKIHGNHLQMFREIHFKFYFNRVMYEHILLQKSQITKSINQIIRKYVTLSSLIC